jgi:hypothetical protein
VLWRRTKLGLRLTLDQLRELDAWMAGHRGEAAPAAPAAAAE